MIENLYKNNKPLFITLIAVIIVIGISVCLIRDMSKNPTVGDEIPPIENPDLRGENNPPDMATSYLFVDISGAVKRPGVYRLAYGSRVVDLIKASGGFKNNAQPGDMNLAKQLKDGEKISVPFIRGVQELNGQGNALAGAKVNINTADEAAFDSLPGVGLSTAKKMIEYRGQCGGFNKIEDLMEIPGIGKAKFERLKDKITVN